METREQKSVLNAAANCLEFNSCSKAAFRNSTEDIIGNNNMKR